MPDRRQPDATTFDLGHYEQMQLALAIEEALIVNDDLDPEQRAVDVDTLRSLRHMFDAPGTVSITHHREESV